MVKVGAIDCGSNSTRLLISNVENGRLQNLLKQHEVTKLSENLIQTNEIADDSKKRFYKQIKESNFKRKIFLFKNLNELNMDRIKARASSIPSEIDLSKYQLPL